MRLDKRRKLRTYMERRERQRTEMRDGVIWEVDEDGKRAWVKIQGSNELIAAVMPQNLREAPLWARPGAAVTIRHREGRRGYIEVHSEGRAVPSYYTQTAFPPELCEEDAIIDGLEMFALNPPIMGVYITAGNYRIDCVYHYIDPTDIGFIVMNDPPPITMGGGEIMGAGGYSFAVPTAPTTSGEARYDLVVVGTGETLIYITGEASASPVYPEVPDEHLQVGYYIYVNYLTTVIEAWNLGYVHYGGTPVKVEMTFTPISPASFSEHGSGYDLFDWCDPSGCGAYPNPECYVKVEIQDMYNTPVTPGGAGYDLDLYLSTGTGQIYSETTGWSGTHVQEYAVGDSSYNFKYRRIEDSTEYSPTFEATLQNTPVLKTKGIIFLEASGEEVRPFG